jgi:hypothetical protein
MSVTEFIKDIFGGPERAFQKLSAPGYFSHKRVELFTIEAYAKWLLKIYVKHGSMAFMRKEEGSQVPQQWLDGLRMIEAEIDKIRKEGGDHLFPKGDGSKMSEDLKT